MLSEAPGCRDKVVALSGELTLPGLGLSEADRTLLREKVSVVFHSGATVRFNEGLRSAARVNVAGTRDVLELATTMTRVQVMRRGGSVAFWNDGSEY